MQSHTLYISCFFKITLQWPLIINIFSQQIPDLWYAGDITNNIEVCILNLWFVCLTTTHNAVVFVY